MARKVKTIEMQRLTVEEFREAEKLPLVVVLDDVRSMHNVGSVFRTGDAFRIEGVCLCGITSTPPSAEIHKTALGAEDSVRWEYFPTATAAVEHLHNSFVPFAPKCQTCWRILPLKYTPSFCAIGKFLCRNLLQIY